MLNVTVSAMHANFHLCVEELHVSGTLLMLLSIGQSHFQVVGHLCC
jgi:hypothetical protein